MLFPPERAALPHKAPSAFACVCLLGVMLCLAGGCQSGSSDLSMDPNSGGLKGNGGIGGSGSGTGGSVTISLPGCSGNGYACLVPKCTGSALGTTISGKVYDPAGKRPVYGAIVYVPDQPDQIPELSQGPGNLCGKCVQPGGSPVVGAVSEPDGSFVIAHAPAGRQIPLVVQLGKWRRMTVVDVNPCVDNPVAPELTRLPRKAGDGQKVSLPKIAIAAGAGDRLQCLLLRMGVDASEFTNPDGIGSVNIYNQPTVLGADPSGRYDATTGNGAVFPDAAAFWSDIDQLSKYDLVLLGCGGNQAATDPTQTWPSPITETAKASMVKYLSSGGRVLGQHSHAAWIRSFPDKASSSKTGGPVPSPLGTDVASWPAYLDSSDPASSAVAAGTTALATIDTTFPKGAAFGRWLLAVHASTTADTFPLLGDLKRTAVDQLGVAPSAQRWLYQPAVASDPMGAAAYVHYLSFNLTSAGQVVDRRATDTTNLCGRFVFTGLHVDSSDTSTHASDLGDEATKAAPFPSCCAQGELNPSEEVLEFMLLDLASCLSLDAQSTASQIVF
jgi:hypothetical protein